MTTSCSVKFGCRLSPRYLLLGLAQVAVACSLIAPDLTVSIAGFNVSPVDMTAIISIYVYLIDIVVSGRFGLNKKLIRPVVIFALYFMIFVGLQVSHGVSTMVLLKWSVNSVLAFAVFFLFAQQPSRVGLRVFNVVLVVAAIVVLIAIPMHRMGYVNYTTRPDIDRAGLNAIRARGRLDSFFWGPSNSFAAKLLIVMISSLSWGVFLRKKTYIVLGVIFLLGIFMTQSRGGILVSLLIVAWLALTDQRSHRVFLGLFMIVLLLGVAISLWTEYDSLLLQRIELEWGILESYINNPTRQTLAFVASGRLARWQQAWEQFRSGPLLGGGWKVSYVSYRWSRPVVYDHRDPHNWIMSVLASSGLVGLTITLTMLRSTVGVLYRYVRNNWRIREQSKGVYMCYGLLMSALGLVLHGLVEDVFSPGLFPASSIGYLLWATIGVGSSIASEKIVLSPSRT